MKFNVIVPEGKEVYGKLVILNNVSRRIKYDVLIDTGASLPVWAAGIDTLRSYYPNAIDTGYTTLLGGFGGKGEEVPVWKIPVFTLSDGNDYIHYTDLHVAVSNMQYSFPMIISFPMIKHAKMVYTALDDNANPTLELLYNCGGIHTEPAHIRCGGREYLNGIKVYAQGNYTLNDLNMDPSTLIAVMEKHSNYTQWFNDNFPNGASSAEEVHQRIVEESMTSS